jgi:hypothetical protein
MNRSVVFFLLAIGGPALAQTTGAVNPTAPLAQPSENEEVPAGGCMPIGLTASGEIVFPIQCQELIERHRGKIEQKPAAEDTKPATVEAKPAAVEDKPAAAEAKPAAVEEKTAAKQPEVSIPAVSSQPTNKQVERVLPSKRIQHKLRARAENSAGCQNYRTYDPASRTYRAFDGHRRPCR